MTGMGLLGMFEIGEQLGLSISSGLAAIAAWIHWIRFRVPITVAAGTATLVAFVVMSLLAMVPGIQEWMNGIIFWAGMLVFGLAMWWDSSDTLRQTRKSDVAFWLHLVAAPMLVHPVFSSLQVFEGKTEPWQAGVVALLYVVIAFVSITIDRRALMVSALSYVLYTFSALLEKYGVVSLNFAFTALAIGIGLLMLSAFWQSCRQAVLRFYPPSLQERFPPCHSPS